MVISLESLQEVSRLKSEVPHSRYPRQWDKRELVFKSRSRRVEDTFLVTYVIAKHSKE